MKPLSFMIENEIRSIERETGFIAMIDSQRGTLQFLYGDMTSQQMELSRPETWVLHVLRFKEIVSHNGENFGIVVSLTRALVYAIRFLKSGVVDRREVSATIRQLQRTLHPLRSSLSVLSDEDIWR